MFNIKKSWRILEKGQRTKEKTAWTFEKSRRKIWAAQIKRKAKKKCQETKYDINRPSYKFITKQFFSKKQAFGKDKARAKKNLPKSPRKKREVISALVSSLSPSSKNHVFKTSRRKLQVTTDWPYILNKIKDSIISFLERQDISYCKPGRQDTVYSRENNKNEKIYQSEHFLLWTIKELVAPFNKEKLFFKSF